MTKMPVGLLTLAVLGVGLWCAGGCSVRNTGKSPPPRPASTDPQARLRQTLTELDGLEATLLERRLALRDVQDSLARKRQIDEWLLKKENARRDELRAQLRQSLALATGDAEKTRELRQVEARIDRLRQEMDDRARTAEKAEAELKKVERTLRGVRQTRAEASSLLERLAAQAQVKAADDLRARLDAHRKTVAELKLEHEVAREVEKLRSERNRGR
jgi:hypothetical protein